MRNGELIIINKPERHQDSYFEMYMLHYFWLLIQKVERNMGTKIPIISKNKRLNA